MRTALTFCLNGHSTLRALQHGYKYIVLEKCQLNKVGAGHRPGASRTPGTCQGAMPRPKGLQMEEKGHEEGISEASDPGCGGNRF